MQHWCRVDFVKPADFLVIQGTTNSGGGGEGVRLLEGGGGAFIEDNTVYTGIYLDGTLTPSRAKYTANLLIILFDNVT